MPSCEAEIIIAIWPSVVLTSRARMNLCKVPPDATNSDLSDEESNSHFLNPTQYSR